MKPRPKPKRKRPPADDAGGEVSFDLSTEQLRQAIFLDPPLLWVDKGDDGEHQSFGILKALDIAQTAADEGFVFEVPALDLGQDDYRAVESCRDWLSGERDMSGLFAFLVRVEGKGGDPRSFVIGVDADGDQFKFSVAKAFRAPDGVIGFSSALFGRVERAGDKMNCQQWGGTDGDTENAYASLIFRVLSLIGDDLITPMHIFDRTKLN